MDYCITGFGITTGFTWTTANEFVMGMQLEDYSADCDLIVTLGLDRVAAGSQNVSIYANDEEVYSGIVDASKPLKYVVPASTLDDEGRLELRYLLPDVISPEERGLGTDGRKLGLGMSTMQIAEVDTKEK